MNACEQPRFAPRASATCHASFGELLQGALPDKRHFLVTLPIELRARAHFSVPDLVRKRRVAPASSWKALRLTEALLLRHGLPQRGELLLESEIERGKGLASSTADLVAVYRAVTASYGLPERAEELEELLRAIEPSDGLMHSGVVAYLHREARLLEHLGPVPAVTLVAVNEGGTVETLNLHRRSFEYSARERDEYAHLLMELRRAFAQRDTSSIGAVATRSAQLNQRLLPKRLLDVMIGIAADVGAAGVVAAHSGTYLGIIVDAFRADSRYQVSHALSLLRSRGLAPRVIESLSGLRLQEPAHG